MVEKELNNGKIKIPHKQFRGCRLSYENFSFNSLSFSCLRDSKCVKYTEYSFYLFRIFP